MFSNLNKYDLYVYAIISVFVIIGVSFIGVAVTQEPGLYEPILWTLVFCGAVYGILRFSYYCGKKSYALDKAKEESLSKS